MPRTESRALELGTAAPDFLLADAFGQTWSLQDFAAPALLVTFISNRCPFVVLIRDRLAALARAYGPGRLAVVAINANDAAAHPEESLARMAEEAAKVPYGFPYLKDESQDVAKAYGAACTPDF